MAGFIELDKQSKLFVILIAVLSNYAFFRPTVVHKFFIKNTIEESIQKAITSDARNWEKNKVTIKQLIGLFDIQANTDEVTNSLEGTVNDV